MDEQVLEYMNKVKEIRSKVKLALFDLYDRCLHPIARVEHVDFAIDTTGKFGDAFIIEIRGTKFNSAHFEIVRRVAEEVLQKKVYIDFSITYRKELEPEPLLARIVIS